MKMNVLALLAALCLAVPAAYAADPGVSAEKTKKTSGKRDGEGRKKYLEDKEKQIDREYQNKTDKVRDGQKGLANSGATQKKVDALEKERDERKKKLRDHYNKGPKAKGN